MKYRLIFFSIFSHCLQHTLSVTLFIYVSISSFCRSTDIHLIISQAACVFSAFSLLWMIIMKLLCAPLVWEYCSALWCALRCWIFLMFHIVEHPGDFQYYTILNILSARRRSQLFSSSFTRFLCVCVCRLTSQATNFHSLNFCSFSIQFFFSSSFCKTKCSELFRISASVEVKWDVLWLSKGVAKRKLFHESVYYLGELEVLHTISSSIPTFFVVLAFFPPFSSPNIYCIFYLLARR